MMRRHGLLGAIWCRIVRECKRCREAKLATARRRLKAMVDAERLALLDEMRAESGRPWGA